MKKIIKKYIFFLSLNQLIYLEFK